MINENDKSNTESKPNFISKEEADKKGDFAQSLDILFSFLWPFVFYRFGKSL